MTLVKLPMNPLDATTRLRRCTSISGLASTCSISSPRMCCGSRLPSEAMNTRRRLPPSASSRSTRCAGSPARPATGPPSCRQRHHRPPAPPVGRPCQSCAALRACRRARRPCAPGLWLWRSPHPSPWNAPTSTGCGCSPSQTGTGSARRCGCNPGTAAGASVACSRRPQPGSGCARGPARRCA